MKKLVLVKLGGSLITDKRRAYKAKLGVMRRLGQEIKEALTEESQLGLVLVHGSGSFGHTSAAKYKTGEGFFDSRGRWGACKTHADAAWINRLLIKEFLGVGLSGVSVSPSSILVAKGRRVKEKFLEPVSVLLEKGMIPVLYGDVIWDEKQGSVIYSGEMILGILADYFLEKRWRLERVVLVGIEEGVYDGEKKVIPLINSENFGEIKASLGESHGTDVTGGMRHKVEESLKLAEKGVGTLIVNGRMLGNLKKAILGKRVAGTEIC